MKKDYYITDKRRKRRELNESSSSDDNLRKSKSVKGNVRSGRNRTPFRSAVPDRSTEAMEKDEVAMAHSSDE